MKRFLMFLLFSAPVFGQTPANVGTLNLSGPGEFTGAKMKQHGFVAVGGIDMGHEFTASCIGCKYPEDAIAGGIEVPAGALTPGNDGIAGYCVTHADSRQHGKGPTGEGANCVGGFFHSHAAADYSAVWGLNPVVNDVATISGHNMQGLEIDMASFSTAGPAVYDGVVVFMGGQKFPPAATGYTLYSDGKNPIPIGFSLGQNATITGEELFPACAKTGSETCGSQTLDFIGTTSHVQRQSFLYADSYGDQMVKETSPNTSLISTGGYSFQFRNNGSVATVDHKLAILSNGTTATVATTGSAFGVVGLVVNSAGTTGNATILVLGPGTCTFDGPATAGHYFQASQTIAGDCHDAGAARPRSNQTLGLITQSIGFEGNATVLMELTP